MLTSIYGRQWNNTTAELAFTRNMLRADLACMKNDPQKALLLYKNEAKTNPLAVRRLKMAGMQNRQMLESGRQLQKRNHIKLGFIDWYTGYENDIQPTIIGLLKKAGLSTEIADCKKADILVAGGYSQELVENKILSADKLVLFVSGENISPAYNFHDFSLTTRRSSFQGKNIRLPQWYGEIDFKRIEFIESTNKMPRIGKDREILFSAIYNNSTPEREAIIAHLREIFGIDSVKVYGSQRGNSVDKLDILSNSRVNICFENSIGDGYTTEKLLHSKMMGCKSLYWGDSSYELDFSDEGVHNVKTAQCLEDTIEWCRNSVVGSEKYQFRGVKIQEDIFARKPSIEDIVTFLRSWSMLILCWRNYQ